MAYGHAERTLATIRTLETETAALLHGLPHLDAEQSAWLHEVNGPGLHAVGARAQQPTAGDVTGADL